MERKKEKKRNKKRKQIEQADDKTVITWIYPQYVVITSRGAFQQFSPIAINMKVKMTLYCIGEWE